MNVIVLLSLGKNWGTGDRHPSGVVEGAVQVDGSQRGRQVARVTATHPLLPIIPLSGQWLTPVQNISYLLWLSKLRAELRAETKPGPRPEAGVEPRPGRGRAAIMEAELVPDPSSKRAQRRLGVVNGQRHQHGVNIRNPFFFTSISLLLEKGSERLLICPNKSSSDNRFAVREPSTFRFESHTAFARPSNPQQPSICVDVNVYRRPAGELAKSNFDIEVKQRIEPGTAVFVSTTYLPWVLHTSALKDHSEWLVTSTMGLQRACARGAPELVTSCSRPTCNYSLFFMTATPKSQGSFDGSQLQTSQVSFEENVMRKRDPGRGRDDYGNVFIRGLTLSVFLHLPQDPKLAATPRHSKRIRVSHQKYLRAL
ncbi:hypothetical protein EVAR_77517_1 [Eumeta japonica]|uniref:Uncharacterized protein n=1 Tax=Eumeta variegata TaxID=151549 RepID=A0A4C1T9J2_EUMVA|nr:hypothetical protein EVAR_77517_1 [Eumeta japonica]